MQVSASQFAAHPVGHTFLLRKPLAMPTCSKCATCAADVFEHARSEVDDADMLQILQVKAASSATVIIEGELLVGGFKAAMNEAKRDSVSAVVNTAGTKLHDFLKNSRSAFDQLRAQDRCLDLEWDDSETFEIDVAALAKAIAWARERVSTGKPVLVNCAQGKSRSGTFACAYLMATRDLDAAAALRTVQERRPFVQPNPGFMAFLRRNEAALRSLKTEIN